MLVVENTDAATASASASATVVAPVQSSVKNEGSYQLLGDVLTRFSDHCTNTVTHTSDVLKSEIQAREWRFIGKKSLLQFVP